MDARENRRANDREKRHRFGGAVDRGAPFLPKQKQDGGNQGAGVTDTDPENEVGDVPGPADRMIQSPGADAGGDLVAEAEETKRRDRCRDRERDPPPARRGLSTTPEIRSVSQLKLRLFRTSGTRASGFSTRC